MKIKPLKHYYAPDYPTVKQIEQKPELLDNIPARWEKSAKFAKILGLGFIFEILLGDITGADDMSDKTVLIARTKDNDSQKQSLIRNRKNINQVKSIVAPILDEALKYDGRGTTGCVAINPPTFLDEAEALEIIRKEFEKAGYKLDENADLDNIEAPESDGFVGSGFREKIKLVPTIYDFDFRIDKKPVFIEYLSSDDYTNWKGRSLSTVQGYDFPGLCYMMKDSFEKYKSNEPVVFALFFDPLVKSYIQRPDTTGLDKELAYKAKSEYWKTIKKGRQNENEKAKKKLQEQVNYFLTYLKEKEAH